jgi:hypothetical protein
MTRIDYRKGCLARLIKTKTQELTNLAIMPTRHLLDQDIYEKSCQLDKLVVKYMRTNKHR